MVSGFKTMTINTERMLYNRTVLIASTHQEMLSGKKDFGVFVVMHGHLVRRATVRSGRTLTADKSLPHNLGSNVSQKCNKQQSFCTPKTIKQ